MKEADRGCLEAVFGIKPPLGANTVTITAEEYKEINDLIASYEEGNDALQEETSKLHQEIMDKSDNYILGQSVRRVFYCAGKGFRRGWSE